MEGRWNILEQKMGLGWNTRMGGPIHDGEFPIPVVPCDDAAIRRAFDALHDNFDLATGWFDDIHGLSDEELREVVVTVLRAAGEPNG